MEHYFRQSNKGEQMKLQILTAQQQPVEGYELVYVERNNIDLTKASDNECELILAPDVLDSFSGGQTSRQVLEALRTKLRIGGELVVGGTDVRLFSKAVMNGSIPLDNASDVVTNTHSMTTADATKETLKALGLKIHSVTLDGLHYEVTARREQ
jgi:hypothetical protein